MSSSAGNVVFEGESAETWLEYNERVLGPMVMARAALEPQGKWDALRADLAELYRARTTSRPTGPSGSSASTW